jgi:MFS family permease
MSDASHSIDSHSSDGHTATSAPYPGRFIAWHATIMLSLLFWLSILDRFIIALLVDPIKRDLGITDVQFSMLHGLAFALTYALFGLVAGALADRFARRWIIFASVCAWSLATAACGFAQNFLQLLLARIGVGIGEAGLNPSATSMITDLFPRERLTSAMAVYTIGATIGSGMAYLIGGVIVDLVTQAETIVLPVIGALRSWQAVFFIVGIPGALLSFAIFTVPEPARRGQRVAKQNNGFLLGTYDAYRTLLKFMGIRWRFFLCHYVGFAISTVALAAGSLWFPAHMGRAFGWSPSKIGLSLGLTLIAAGIAGKLIGGFLVDTMYRRGYRDAPIRWYAACLVVATPIGILATTSDNPLVFLGGIGLFLMLSAPMPACASAALNLVTPNELRGTGAAFFAATAAALGAIAGPILVATVSEHIFAGQAFAVGKALATVIGICCPLSAVVLALGFKSMRDAMKDADSWVS